MSSYDAQYEPFSIVHASTVSSHDALKKQRTAQVVIARKRCDEAIPLRTLTVRHEIATAALLPPRDDSLDQQYCSTDEEKRGVIYMVDHVYADPTTEQAWHEWYAGYLQKLVSVPGIHTAQRFKAVGCTPSRYLAMYSIESEEVYSSEAYKKIGGGGSQSARFHHAYQLWTRNLFDGASRAPAVGDGQRVLVFDREVAPHPDPRITSGAPPLSRAAWGEGDMLLLAVWLKAVALHMTTKYRAFIVLDADQVATIPALPGSYIYQPFTAVLKNRG